MSKERLLDPLSTNEVPAAYYLSNPKRGENSSGVLDMLNSRLHKYRDLARSGSPAIKMPVMESPEQSKRRFKYSKNVRLTSNERDFDPEFLIKTVRLNNIHHKQYNPTFKNKEWSKHFKEVFEKLQSTDQSLDFEKEFGLNQRYATGRQNREGPLATDTGRVTLYNPSEIKSVQDLRNYKRGLCTSRVFKQFKGNIELQEITNQSVERDKLSQERIVENQLYILNQYRKNMVRPTATGNS